MTDLLQIQLLQSNVSRIDEQINILQSSVKDLRILVEIIKRKITLRNG